MSKRYFSLLILLLFFSFPPSILFAEDEGKPRTAVPKHSIVLKTGKQLPEWMQRWERARKLVRLGNKVEAAKVYSMLLTEKPRIEEALREYVLVLMGIKEWETAGTVLQRLLELDSGSLEYKLYGGRIALVLGHYQRASTFLGQVYSMNPNGPNSLEALRGQIVALQKQGLKEMAYPLMEQLYLLVPHEDESIRHLASYSLELGYKDKAKMYYKTLLTEFSGTDVDYLQSEPLFVESNDVDMLVRCWLGYLEYHPFYLPFNKKISSYYLNSENKGDALPHLLIRIAHGEDQAKLFLQIGKLYLYEKGRPDKALYYYDEYQKRSSEDPSIDAEIKRIQAILANDLLVIVENEGAWNLWRDLAKIIPDRLAVYYSMADQLEELNKPKELREVLEIIHLHNPGDQEILFHLAQLAFEEGDYEACTEALDSLAEEMKTGREYFLLRAKIAEKNQEMSHALANYKSYLLENTNDYRIVLRSMQLAGELGLIEELNFFYGFIPGKRKNRDVFYGASFLYAEILVQHFLFSTARDFYENLTKNGRVEESRWMWIHEQLAKILQYEEKYFEAEQELRLLLLKSGGQKKYLRDLVQNAILAKDWESAWKWHEYQVLDSKDLNDENPHKVQDLFLEKLSILSESGRIDTAVDQAEDFLEQHPTSKKIKTKLVDLYYRNIEFSAAQAMLPAPDEDDQQNFVLRNLIEERTGTVKEKRKIPFSSLLDKASQYEKYGANEKALQCVSNYLEKRPTSLRGRVHRANLLQASGDNYAALALFQEFSKKYPQETYFKEKILELQFEVASFETIIAQLAPGWQARENKDALLIKQDLHPQILTLTRKKQFLLARAFWATGNRDDALRIYSFLLQPPVDQVFSERLEAENVTLKLPPVTRSFWNHVTFTTPPEPDRLSVVMSPEFTRNNMGSAAVETVTELYADYRWQQQVSEELSVRQDMVDGNYYQAMKEYQGMLGSDISTESLFDLAGIYSRLGYLGKEATLYKIIKSQSPGYPDLDEAMQRNRLKRRPRLAGIYNYVTKDGRDGYFDNRQQTAGVQSCFMPSLKHQVSVDYKRIYNETIDSKQDLWRNRLQAEMKWSPSYDLDFLMRLGADRGDGEYSSTLLYEFRVNGRLGDMAEGFFNVSQDVVDDTVESLRSGVSATAYEGGVRFDLLPRLFGGGNYLYTEYSDANYQNKYELWTSYTLLPEPTLLQLRYDYAISHNDDGNKGRDSSSNNGFLPGDHPYWSPKEHWQNIFSVSFEHQLAEDVLGRGAPSYYTFEYSLGYEEGGYDNHQFNAQIFLEISRHLLLNSSFTYVSGAEYEKEDFLVSLIYRW